jgi:hypothetical protein
MYSGKARSKLRGEQRSEEAPVAARSSVVVADRPVREREGEERKR